MRRRSRRLEWLGPDLGRLLGAAALWGFAFSSFYLLPKFLIHELGAGPDDIGFVVGILGLATVACTPLTGRWIDRAPCRHAFVAGALVMGASALGFLAVGSVGALLGVLRVLQGASYALVVTAVGTLVSELVPAARLGQALGLSGASMLVMNAVAPALVEPLAAAAGWQPVFVLAAATALASAALATRVAEPARPARDRSLPAGLLAVLRRPLGCHYAIVIALAGAGFGAVMTFEPPYVLALGADNVRPFFVAYAAAAIGVRLTIGHLPDRLGRRRAALGSLAAYGAAILALAGMRPETAPLLGAVFGAAHGLFFPALNALVVAAVPRAERGRIVAIFTGAFSLGLWAGASLLGLVAARAGYPAVFVLAAGGVACAIAVLAASPALKAAAAAPAERRALLSPRP